MKKHTRHTVDTILAMRGQKRPPEVIARMTAAQQTRRAREKENRVVFKHTIETRLALREMKPSPETIARMCAAQSARRTAEKEIADLGAL